MSANGYYIEDLSVGQAEEFSKTVTEADLVLYAGVTGDTNPVHLDEEFAAQTMFKTRIAHGMLSAGFISAVLGAKMPGPGAIYVSQELKFKAPVKIGDTVTARCTVKDINAGRRRVTLHTECLVKDKVVVEGEAVMMVANRP
ncbi:MAG: MaoC family dehydratase [Alphaproteobacteria bacterium]|nr:MAG: MaoC family dehydratase [Alphaproteobacteria bacterium]